MVRNLLKNLVDIVLTVAHLILTEGDHVNNISFYALLAIIWSGVSCQQPSTSSNLKKLSNGRYVDIYHRSETYYTKLKEKFQSLDKDLEKPDISKLQMIWPLKDQKTYMLQRYGLMQNAKFVDGDDSFGVAYLHDALDIARSNTQLSKEVIAPVSGLAFSFFDLDKDNPSSLSVIIFNPESNLLVSLLHVVPDPLLFPDDGVIVEVEAGQRLGELAIHNHVLEKQQEENRHIHLSVVDLFNNKLLNPLIFFQSYKDSHLPAAKGVYIMDDEGQKKDSLVSGKIDVILDAFDMDGQSLYNLDISYLEIEITDQSGNVIYNLDECNLKHYTEKLDNMYDIRDMFDLENDPLHSEYFKKSEANVQKKRSFKYVLTHLKEADGFCLLEQDEQSFLQIDDSVQSIIVKYNIMDFHRNAATGTVMLSRGE